MGIVLHTKGLSEVNYCYLSGTMTGILTVMLSGKDGEAYNIANLETHTIISDMANMVAEKMDRSCLKNRSCAKHRDVI
jgi:dTDP-D-glucose 4,6-dehydratase